MKKLFAITVLMALAMSAFAYDFSAVCESGQTLYYNLLNDHEVEITYPYVNSYGYGSWLSYTKPTGNLVIPAMVENEGTSYTVVSIGNEAFCRCDFTSVEIPNSVTSIGGWAFYECYELLSLTIGSSVSSIGTGAFLNCWHLESIHCNTPVPPSYVFFYGFMDYFNPRIFQGVHNDIPVYVNCLSLNQFQSDPQWKQFTNLIGTFVGVPELNVSCNVPGLGTTEIVSLPEDCDHNTATVRAIPNPGHEFCYWKNGMEAVSTLPEYTFTLDQNTSLIACFDCLPIVYDSIAYPDHVVGRIFDSTGQIAYEHSSDFIYDIYGQLIKYDFPGIIVSDYVFADNPIMPSGIHNTRFGYPEIEINEWFYYTFDNNRIKYSEKYDELGKLNATYYSYDENWRILQIKINNSQGTPMKLNLFEYADNYRTKIDSYYDLYPTQTLLTRTTSHYNERQQVLSIQVDTYDDTEEITSKKLNTYSYTSNNKTDNIITQTFTNEEWVNTNIAYFVYDDKNRLIEYKTGLWSTENQDWNISKKVVYDFDDENQKLIVSFLQKSGDEWVWYHYSGNQPILYEPELKTFEEAIYGYHGFGINQFEIDLHYVTKEKEEVFPSQSEWYYEIQWDDGSTTYQHLEYTSDTTIGTSRPKVIVRSNTHYDRDTIFEVTHEYILEEGNKVYWWNRDLEEFTLLYDYDAEPGDEWEIKVGLENIMVHVDDVDIFEYDGENHKRLYISDVGNIFNGEIVVGFGHMTSFFPEKLMNRGKGFRVDGLRCYWVEDALLYHNGDEDCDAVHSVLQDINEPTDNAVFAVHPNPTNSILYVETFPETSPQDKTTYRITNLMGQTLLQGHITAENQQIDIANLPAGMYFICIGETTQKFIIQ